MSLLRSTSWPRSCSGDMYEGLPLSAPPVVSMARAAAFATPKSMRRVIPSAPTRTFLWAYVAMHDTQRVAADVGGLVGRVQSGQHVADDAYSDRRRQRHLPQDRFSEQERERDGLDVFEDDAELSAVLDDVEQVDDVWMPNERCEACFFAEHLGEAVHEQEVTVHALEDDQAFDLTNADVSGHMDRRHTSRGKGVEQLVLPYALPEHLESFHGKTPCAVTLLPAIPTWTAALAEPRQSTSHMAVAALSTASPAET